ncbi:Mrp/NBP35 family ATP-binding protein [Alkaliphilus oremlandii]|uniref:Iron-sulfur cluster carrier protein n=1 Tax=Alkaliphilus oremlandii (strain OhILAs) TaxID=350688 RepID=A8MLI0_ALKOO|nr:Mrp/NBP35 family ATP-binding protein [Alkaliphilus oremlandii]ABW18094.1 ATPase involved in chromosome partitioning [Alkaliphilus oremlandii OhILAs]
MSNKCDGCQHNVEGGCSSKSCIVLEKENQWSSIEKVIGIMSGKGGVGKSSVTSLLAATLAKKGYAVGILDGDITGPSIPRLFGLKGQARQSEEGLLPTVAEDGVKVMSMNLLLSEETEPVIWRGPVVSGVMKQFWTDVVWGELDYLLIDFPPGTGDVALTAMQSLPIDGIVMVTSPQGLVSMIVNKGIHMAEKMNVPVLGLVENMSYVQPPSCSEPYYLFGKGKTEEVAKELGVDFLGSIPIEQEFAELSDQGKVFEYTNENFDKIANKVIKKLKAK